MEDIQEALRGALKLYIRNKEPIPEPVDKKKFKGNIAYRTSNERHYAVAKMAKQKHTSISKVIDMLIDRGMDHLFSI